MAKSLPLRRCPKCNQPYQPGTPSCPACGAELVRRCPLCGTPRPWDIPFCPKCQSQAADESLFNDLFRPKRSGTLAGRYRIDGILHSGRITTIYRAHETTDRSRIYAIKEISTLTLIRFEERQEAEAELHRVLSRWQALEHPALTHITDYFQERDAHYIVFEYAPGWSGERLIAEETLITPAMAIDWGIQLCDLLQYLHGRPEPLHIPFLAPSHLVISPEGTLKLVGYGLGATHAPGLYGPYGSITGYKAPELAQQPPDAQTDIFAVGRLLYAFLIGRLLEKGLPRPIPLRQAVPEAPLEMAQILAQAAHRERAYRFATAEAFRRALEGLSAGKASFAPGWPQNKRSSRREKPHPASAESMENFGFVPDPRFIQNQVPEPAPTLTSEQPRARLAVHPREFDLHRLPAGSRKRLILRVRNPGEANLRFRLISYVDWLRAPSGEVTLAPSQEAKVIVSIDVSRIGVGTIYEPRALAVDANIGRQWIGVRAEIETAPVLALEPQTLDFGRIDDDAERTVPLLIRNEGRQVLTGQCEPRVPWLQVSAKEFQVASGGQVTLTIRLLPSQLPAGPQQVPEALVIDSNGGQARVAVNAWRARPRLEIEEHVLRLGALREGETIQRPLILRNSGDAPLIGTIRSTMPWIQPLWERWTCAPGEVVSIPIVYDLAGLACGPLRVPRALRVQSNGGEAALSVELEILAPKMEVEPLMLDFGSVSRGERPAQGITIRNSGSAPLEVAITPLVDWLILSEEQVICPPGESRHITVMADTSRFEQGTRVNMPAVLRLVASNALQELGGRLEVLQPALEVEPAEIDFGYVEPAEPAIQTLTIRNQGIGELAWHTQTDAEWVEINPPMGVCPEGGQTVLTLTAYALALEADKSEAEGVLVINSDGGRAKVPLHLALASPRLAVDRTFVDLGTSVNLRNTAASIRLFNRGLGRLRGTIKTDRLWLVTDRTSFECDTGRSVEINIHTDMEEFPAQTDEDRGLITIESNGGTWEIDVLLRVEFRAEIAPPEPVALAWNNEAQTFQGRLILRNIGMATAHVTLDLGEDITASRRTLEIKPEKSVHLALQWEGEPVQAPYETSIAVHTETETFRVPVRVLPKESAA